MTPQPLDPRKTPWKRGDLCTRGFEKAGFVLAYTSEYLEIRWNGGSIEKVPALEIDDILRVAHADDPSPAGRRTNLESLNALEVLERIRNDAAKRTFKHEREKSEANGLFSRSFATDGCDWDKRNANHLLMLALQPENVGVVFKIRERFHRLFCSQTRNKQLTDLETILNRLEEERGGDVPVPKWGALLKLMDSKLANIEDPIQKIVDRAGRATIDTESLRRSFEDSKTEYSGPNRDAFAMEMDKILESLGAKKRRT